MGREHYGKQAFEELTAGQAEEPDAVSSFLQTKLAACADETLLGIAVELDPADPIGTYMEIGGRFDYSRVKLAASPPPRGGLKPEVKLFAHQQSGSDKIIGKGGNLLLSHPVGSGKTLTSIAAFERMRQKGDAKRALVVTPASLRTNYVEGVKKFTNSQASVFGNAQEVSQGAAYSPERPDRKADYHVVSYDMFRKDPKRYIESAGADTVIYDELHKAKNEGVKTTKAIKDARPFHKNFIGMTGSIVSNTPADIVPLVDAMTNGEHMLGNKSTFEARFVKTDDKGNKSLRNGPVVRALLAPYVHHIDKDALAQNTPKKIVQEVRVDMSPQQKDLYNYVRGKLDPITKMRLTVGTSGLSKAQVNDTFAKLLRLRQVSNSMQTLDDSLTLEDSADKTPKMKKLLDDVEEHLGETSDGQVVIHSNMIQGGVDVLSAGLKKRNIPFGTFIGKGNVGITEKARQADVKDYQEGRKKVLLISAAGGEGLDLPNTTFVAMADGHFNPEKINQAEARGVRAGGQSHRDAQNRQVLVRRYVSVMPTKGTDRAAEVAKNLYEQNPVAVLSRLGKGAPGFYNPFAKEKATDEWIYGVAKAKGGLNKELYGQMKHGSAQEPDFETCEDFEDWLSDGFEPEKIAGVARALVGAGVGAPLGAIYGAGSNALLISPMTKREKEQDPHRRRRQIVSGAIGGAIGGAFSGVHSLHNADGILSAPGIVDASTNAGTAIGNLAAPQTAVPRSVRKLLGKRQDYTDRAVFEKYWETFGSELEDKGMSADVSDPAMEAKFVSALKDIYQEAKLNPQGIRKFDPKKDKVERGSKKNFLISSAVALPVVAGWGGLKSALPAILANQKPDLLGVAAAGGAEGVGLGAVLLKSYRDMFIDPGVAVTNKTEAKTRAKFNEEQLRDLLRGKTVEEVKTKQHAIR